MESNNAVIGAAIFIALIIGANLLMYGIARGWAMSNRKDFLETLTKSLTTPTKKDDSMDELRQKIEELEKRKKENS